MIRFFNTLHRRLEDFVPPDSLTWKALAPDGDIDEFLNSPQGLSTCGPAFSGAFTARSLARMYAALERGGELDGVRLLRPETVETATTVQNTRSDLVLMLPIHWRLGFMSGGSPISPTGPNSEAYGHAGYGGSVAFADPKAELGFAIVCDRLEVNLLGVVHGIRAFPLACDRFTAVAPGDVRGYRASCNRLLQAAADARAAVYLTDVVPYDNDIYAAWIAGVSSASPANWDQFVQPAQEAVSNAASENEMFYRETTGILLYRAARYREAAEELGYVGRYSSTGYSVESMFVLALAKEKLGEHNEAVNWYIDALKGMGAWETEPATDVYSFETAPVAPAPQIWEIRLRREFLRAEADEVFKDEIAPGAPP